MRTIVVGCVLLFAGRTPALGQGILDEFSYEGLAFSGFGIGAGRVATDRLTGEWMPVLMVDYGMIAPQVRVMFGASYFRGDLGVDEIAEFEASLGRVVQDPTNDAVIDIGQIRWTNVEATLDLQYVFAASPRLLPFLGAGLGVHVRDGSGPAIDETFVEDALDTIAAGANLSVGVETVLSDNFRFLLEARGGWTSELLLGSVRLGFMYRVLRGGS